MAIIRTADIDDDGTGTTGTIRDNAWKQQLYDQIDATVGAVVNETKWTYVQLALPTGTIHNWNPGIVGHTLVHCVGGTAGFTFTGLTPVAAPFNGQTVLVINETGQTVTMQHQTGSANGSQLALQGTTKTFMSYWSYARFQYLQPVGLWMCVGFANGHGV